MHQPSPIILNEPTPKLSDVDFSKGIIESKKEYQHELSHWQKRLLAVQQAYFHQGRRVIIVLEGWDASGKGGLIRRITERLDPRGFRVYPIAAPSKEEQGRHYLYRFQKALPPPGRIAIFDRSYFGRVLVERVEGFASVQEWQRAYQEINEFERMLIDDGVRIIKAFIHISPEEQLQRFKERLQNPVKRWKLTEEDIRNREKWPIYEQAINEMFARTSTEHAPWHLVNGNHKWYARVSALKGLVLLLERGVDTSPPPIDPDMVQWAKSQLGMD
ncbi:polyphosphate kinase 2 family protein [Thalassotalea sp. PS06]|uniref:polyphosphate kinase 2 family protein n=1 Tax=Thalassotalea sp. PS06 TaxID=2594005 RepID=UPI001163BADE|nr:polyphosphate kinase [Thalassotalea sp. PS06]QDP02324.1 polyphosphate kinase [Thalassotalea sp. PS06]